MFKHPPGHDTLLTLDYLSTVQNNDMIIKLKYKT